MTSFASNSLRLLRRLLRPPVTPAASTHDASPCVLDGLSAIACTEAMMSGTAALGATYPAAVAARAWSRTEPGVEASSARGALAAAIGLGLSGERATAFLSGPDAMAGQDLLAQAAGLHVPLVLHLAARATAGHATALGSGHEAYHAAADRGLFLLFATNVQEAVDLAVIARRVAERTLVPGLVAMDAEQTGLAAQEVVLPGAALAREIVGAPGDRIDAPTETQRMLYGPVRRRVPRGYDLERPVMLAPREGPESWGLGAAGQRPFYHGALEDELADAVRLYAERTGRVAGALRTHRLDDADVVLVAQGAAVETAIAVADSLPRAGRPRVGVLGVRRLRPFPGAEIVEALQGASVAAVLERVDTPLAGDGPLARDVRAALGRAAENDRSAGTHPGYPALRAKDAPGLVDVPFGLGGLPLRAADLVALARELAAPTRTLVYLGVDFLRDAPAYPKRQALVDALRRTQGELAEGGLLASDPPPDVRPEGAQTIAIHRRAGASVSLAGDAASLLHAAVGGFLRTRPALTWSRFETPCVDHLTIAPTPLGDPGDDVPVDIALLADPVARPAELEQRLVDGGTILLTKDAEPTLPVAVLRRKSLTVYVVDASAAEDTEHAERLLGGLLALFATTTDTEITAEHARTLREAALESLPAEERDRRLDAFGRGFESLERVELAETPDAPPAPEVGVPPAVREMRRADGTVDCVSGFWDRTGVLYRTGDTDQLAADPYAAAGVVPPLTSTFRDVSAASSRLLVLDPASCDGDPALWTSCPDGSVAAIALTPRELIDAGIALVATRGGSADALRSVAAKLARGVSRRVRADEPAPPTAGGLLHTALDGLELDDDRRTTLAEPLALVVNEIGTLPLARTASLFDEPEQARAGTGALLAVVVNPDACRSPELLLAVGGAHGLTAVDHTPASLAETRALWALAERLPDTSGETIEHARTHPRLGPMAALMLSRHCRCVLAPGDGAEAGSGARLALRNVLAVAEYHAGPRIQAHLETVDGLRRQLAERIRVVLAEGLPTQDLGALAEGLDLLGQSDVDLGALSARVNDVVETGRIDGVRLGRLVDVARELADLQWRVSRGPDGLGRARAGLVIAPDGTAGWAGAHPHNPFACPVVIDACGETGDLARGLLEGQLRQVLAGLRVLRWARLELEDPDHAADAAESLAGLGFRDLTDDERALCPPIFLVGDGGWFGGRGLAQLTWLLGTGLPVKAVVLNGIGGVAGSEPGVDAFDAFPDRQPFDLGLLAALGRKAFVVQTSIAHPDHLADGVARALAFDGPALIHLHAPSAERHGFPVTRLFTQARLAVASRAFPLFTFDPARGGVFGACFDLAGNPGPAATWATDDEGQAVTPVEWAATETRFAAHRPPTPALVADAAQRERLWRTLQELAGVVTPFTEQVQDTAARSVADAHRVELEALTRSYEAKLAEARARFEVEAAERVTTGLMALAGYDAERGEP